MPHTNSTASREPRAEKGKVIVGATMSLDGFVADRNGDVSRLYPDLEALRNTAALQDSIQTTGAVVMAGAPTPWATQTRM